MSSASHFSTGASVKFLDEAQEHFRHIEAVLLGLHGHPEGEGLDEAMRAAHSVKGSAAMLGIEPLSRATHRLEDFLKILQARRPEVDSALQSLLLRAFDGVRSVADAFQRGHSVDDRWLAEKVWPQFQPLQLQLGDLTSEDEAALLVGGDDPASSIRMLFASEVDCGLTRLEEVLKTPGQPCIDVELRILAQEMADLGDMLQLAGFESLSRSILERLESAPSDASQTAQMALSAWRHAQSLVLVGQSELIPRTMEETGSEVPIAPLTSTAVSTNLLRVPQERMERLSDLCSELFIEHNGLGLQLGRLRSQVAAMASRVRQLDLFNQQLRMAYDQFAAQAGRVFQPNPAPTEDFDSLEMDFYSALHPLWQDVMETTVWVQETTGDIELSLYEAEQASSDIGRTTRQLRVGMQETLMHPFSEITDHFQRAIHNLAVEYEKPVVLNVIGADTLVESRLLAILADPLMHILRNAFDHGIEPLEQRLAANKPHQGTIVIQAAHQGNRLVVSIGDDGAGINTEKIRRRALGMGFSPTNLEKATEAELCELIFEPGFTTADQVTTLSGRGVGMDIVRNAIKAVGGTVSVETTSGQGATFVLTAPLNLSSLRTLLVETGGLILAVPSFNVRQVSEIPSNLSLKDTFDLEGKPIPLISVSTWLHCHCPLRSPEMDESPRLSVPSVLILAHGEGLAALPIRQCWFEREVAIRYPGDAYRMPTGFNGCTILGNGQVAPLVDVAALFDWLSRQESTTLPPAPTRSISARPESLLVVDDSINVRRYLASCLEKAGYHVEQAKDGLDALERLQAGLKVQGIITDIEMPRLDGFGLLARLRRHNQNLPVAILTSRSGEKHRQLAMSLGADAYFTKPYRDHELLDGVAQLLAKAQS